MISRGLAVDVQGGFLPLVCIVDLSSSLVAVAEDVFRVVTCVLDFIIWLRGSPLEVLRIRLHFARAHAHSNVADNEDKSDGENGEEDDQVLDCVSHGSLLFFNDLGLGHLRDQELLLFLSVLSI